MQIIPKILNVVFKYVCVSLNISGNFLPKNRLAINRNKYWLPCKELTRAGVAKDTEKVIKSSEDPPTACPNINKIPILDFNENLEPSFLTKTILRVTGIKKIIIARGIKIILDQTRTVKKSSIKKARRKMI